MVDFFISYNQADREWAEWIAWELEENSYTTVIQAWDFRGNFVLEMDKATKEAERTIAVLSPEYVNAIYTKPEWAAAFANDPTSEKCKLIPVRVKQVELKGLLAQINYVNFVDCDEHAAKELLLARVRGERLKPSKPPDFPGGKPVFPGPKAATAPASLAELIEQLREQLHRAANRLPEGFPAGAMLHKLNAVERRFRGGHPGRGATICCLGDLAREFRELARAIEAESEATRPALQALAPLVQHLIQAVEQLGGRVAADGGTRGPWPGSWQPETRERLDGIQKELETAREETDDADDRAALDDAEACVQSLYGEVEKPRPNWTTMRTESRELMRALQPGAEPGLALGEVLHGSRALFAHLGEVIEQVIAALPDLAVFQDLSETPEMVIIPAGRFLMGSPSDEKGRDNEGPQHEVRIAHRLAVGRYPVTFEEYDRFAVATSRERPSDENWGRGRRPVINVSWKDAKAYVTWLGEQTGQSYRLLSEAEWEYACRAGTTTRYSWSDDITAENANYDDSGTRKTTKVGTYQANRWGLYDMHGNVDEYVEDRFHGNYDGAPTDGSAWTNEEAVDRRMLRGGTWRDHASNLRSAYRVMAFGDFLRDCLGFRVARTLR